MKQQWKYCICKEKYKKELLKLWTVNIFDRNATTQHWHYRLLSREFHIRNLLSTRVLLTRFFLPRLLRIKRNICNEKDVFQYMSFLAQWRQHTVLTPNTDHLLYVCQHRCKHKTLRSEVDDTEEQSVKDQQRGLISIKQDITKGVGLICSDKCKQTLHKRTHTVHTVYKQTEMYSLSGPRGHYRCKRCFFHWVQGTPSL